MLKQSYSRVKKILAILLTVLFVVSVTATACNALNPQPLPPVVKEEKTAIIFLKDVKTKIFKHHHKHTNMSGRKGKKMAMKTGTEKYIPMKTGTEKNIPIKGSNTPMNS